MLAQNFGDSYCTTGSFFTAAGCFFWCALLAWPDGLAFSTPLVSLLSLAAVLLAAIVEFLLPLSLWISGFCCNAAPLSITEGCAPCAVLSLWTPGWPAVWSTWSDTSALKLAVKFVSASALLELELVDALSSAAAELSFECDFHARHCVCTDKRANGEYMHD